MGDGVSGIRPKFSQGFPPMGEIVRVWGRPRQLPAIRRPTSWRINLAAPQVRGVVSWFRQGFPPRGVIVRVDMDDMNAEYDAKWKLECVRGFNFFFNGTKAEHFGTIEEGC